ncbi:MAG: A/G-specific adenine glycosylase [Nitriliruptoraceae bacterium]
MTPATADAMKSADPAPNNGSGHGPGHGSGHGFGHALLSWGTRELRDLPWRATRDPWAILVAESMLQQTQVDRVVGPYHAFLARFPTAAECAGVPVAEVIRYWAGLGYNRRAVRLHGAATAVMARHGGAVPGDLDELLALPGVGSYTARAILAFAFEADHGVVDTNAGRVMARAVAGRRLTAAEAQRLADSVVPRGQAWLWNQTVLDLGATVCRSADPSCNRCPVAPHCCWAAAGHPSPDPAVGGAASPRRQATFEGSDRQVRGRLIAALRQQPIPYGDVARVAGVPADPTRAHRLADALAAEGMAEWNGQTLALPGDDYPPSASQPVGESAMVR